MSKEKRSVNLPTVRATPSEAKDFEETIKRLGFDKASHFWRRCLTQVIDQNKNDREVELPLRFVEKEKARKRNIPPEPDQISQKPPPQKPPPQKPPLKRPQPPQ
jgi:hypothetical protein